MDHIRVINVFNSNLLLEKYPTNHIYILTFLLLSSRREACSLPFIDEMFLKSSSKAITTTETSTIPLALASITVGNLWCCSVSITWVNMQFRTAFPTADISFYRSSSGSQRLKRKKRAKMRGGNSTSYQYLQRRLYRVCRTTQRYI